VPALAFSQTTGMDVHMITPAVMFICIFYTCLGGIKVSVIQSNEKFSVKIELNKSTKRLLDLRMK